jgi:hypothetical protein
MATKGTILVGTIGQGVMLSDDGGEGWRKLGREFGEVSSILWVAR